MVRSASQRAAKEGKSGGGGGKASTPGSRASSRLRPNMAGVVRTDYEVGLVPLGLTARLRVQLKCQKCTWDILLLEVHSQKTHRRRV